MASSPKRRARPVRKAPEDFGETCLHKHCQQWLEKSGTWSRLLIFHVPNERRGGIGAIMHFKRMGVRPGVADYLALTSRSKVAIEIKDEDGKQRKGQEQFKRHWRAIGGVYVVVRSLQEFQDAVKTLELFG